ncbi:ecto-ADP-ribosyltransferase 5-like [Myxocyprinus asiaticus]|uniref:ecto-ADP-ribosyltransferase 5-like n=1 Tax=Myxocyprinus asiaticus TaxID=70543 RepID=UPI0022224AEE|nr:ecto-ADP-ribosyltransferase 5-like [Myxocyprinus asiaticus]
MASIAAYILILTVAIGQDHRVVGIYELDLVPNSVDDIYGHCMKTMEKLVEKTILEKEKKESPNLAKAWEKFNMVKKTYKLPRNLLGAIYVYTSDYVYRDFNNAVRTGKQLYKDKKFQWYSLYFLLTKAIQFLKKRQNKCFKTYRGTSVEFNTNVLNKEFRFGSFASSSQVQKVAQRFGTKSCFEIITCHGADLTQFSAIPGEKEVLIPPYETFKVTEVITNKKAWCDTVFKVKSTRIKSELDCALLK